MREFNEREKEIIRLIADYDFEAMKTFTLFLQEKYFIKEKGIAMLIPNNGKTAFLLYSSSEFQGVELAQKGGHIVELVHLVNYLFENRYLSKYAANESELLIISSRANIKQPYADPKDKQKIIVNAQLEYIDLTSFKWYNKEGQVIYENIKLDNSGFNFIQLFNNAVFVSQDLKNFVKADFKTPEERRFEKELLEAKTQTKYSRWAFLVSLVALIAAIAIPLICDTKLAEKDEIIKVIQSTKTEIPAVIETKITNDTIKVDIVKPTPISK